MSTEEIDGIAKVLASTRPFSIEVKRHEGDLSFEQWRKDIYALAAFIKTQHPAFDFTEFYRKCLGLSRW